MKNITCSIAAAGLFAGLALAQATQPRYNIFDLGPVGPPPGQPYVIANNSLISGVKATAGNQVHATIWFMGMTLDIGAAGLGGPNSAAYGINEKGQAVGAAQTAFPNGEDFCGFGAAGLAGGATSCQPFVWQNGTMKGLPTLGGPNGYANMINDRGQAVGLAETTGKDPNSGCAVHQFSPVLWGSSGVTQLKTFGSDPDGVAAAINDNGQIVGASGTCTAYSANSGLFLLEKHALLWESGLVLDLGNLGGTGANSGIHACALNNQGQVVGHSDLAGDATFHGFLWTWQTGMKDIGTLSGDSASLALGIDGSGIVVGASLDENFNPRAFVYQNGSMTDLNTLSATNPSQLYLLFALSINASGSITGFGVTSNGDVHGFLATPATGAEILAGRCQRDSSRHPSRNRAASAAPGGCTRPVGLLSWAGRPAGTAASQGSIPST